MSAIKLDFSAQISSRLQEVCSFFVIQSNFNVLYSKNVGVLKHQQVFRKMFKICMKYYNYLFLFVRISI